MKRLLLLSLMATAVIGQGNLPPKKPLSMPSPIPKDRIYVTFSDTVVLKGSFWDVLFHRDVRQTIRFRDLPVAQVDGAIVSIANVKGEEMHERCGCRGVQLDYDGSPDQGPFYFDDRSEYGMTIRGKDGMRIRYSCTIAIKKVKLQ